VQGKKALPILFGSHRKPEAVLVPVKLWKKIINELDELQLALTVSERMSNSQEGEAMSYEQFAAEMQVIIDKKRALEDAERKKNEGR
jgi:PHD/YefM family antitoxin component YafN of YafNO toxin-antitoxin module